MARYGTWSRRSYSCRASVHQPGTEGRIVERSGERRRGRRVGDDSLAPGPVQGCERRADLRDHTAGDRAVVDQRLRFRGGQRVESVAGAVTDTVHVGQQDELPRAQSGRNPGRGVVGVDVAHDAVLIACERRDDRHLVRGEDRVEQVSPEADDVGDEPDVGQPLGDQQASVDAGQADSVDPQVAQRADELAVDDAPQDRGGNLERRLVGDTEAALEPALDAQAVEPFADASAAAVAEDDGTAARARGYFLEAVPLVLNGCATELHDQYFAHVVYSLFSRTYSSVRSQPNASPVPSPSPRSSRNRTSGASIAIRAAARSNSTGPPSGPSYTRWPAMPIRTRAGSTRAAALPAAPARRPQFGSRPCTAAFTRLLDTTDLATARASASFAAPLT